MITPQTSSKELSKQLEFVKQQQQLRALGNMRNSANNLKTLSAESMIEDLLSKKETFQKRNPETQQKQETPAWLSGAVHPLYERVWAGVQVAGGLADTPVLSSLLMSSGLPTDTLGYIWSVANRTVPGALTQQEVYLVLALVGLAQTGYVVNNLAALLQLPQAPVPTLDLTLLPSQVAGSHVYPNPLNVTSLPDPQTFNWVSADTQHSNVNDKIGISYVSSGPMVSPKLLTDQITKNPNKNLTDFSSEDNIEGKMDISSSNLPMNVGFDLTHIKSHSHTKHSNNSYSFSFPSLNESPSHVKHDDSDPFDDEFTDFQSADFTSVSGSAQIETHSDSVIDDEDEFSNFQKASPKLEDDLSVLVIGGRNIPTAQQLWVAESPTVSVEREKFHRVEAERRGMVSNVPETVKKDKPVHVLKSAGQFEKKDHSDNKYDVFQEIDDDEFSVFHNPLPDGEDKHSVSGNTIESVNLETKSIFNHSLFEDPVSADLFRNEQPSLELPKLSVHSDRLKDGATENDDDDEFSNFHTFSATFPDTTSTAPIEKNDKYDVFRTIVFQDTDFESNTISVGKSEETVQESFPDFQSYEAEMGPVHNVIYNQETDKYSLFSNMSEKQNEDLKFGDFQESVTLPLNKNSNIDSLFSSLAISEKPSEKDTKDDISLDSVPTEDKYKALRLLETTSSEVDEFGEFFGAELPNSGNEPQNKLEQASIQFRCLEACLNLLKAGLSTLSRASSQEVVSEVLSDPRASTYLDCLLEVHRVSDRIICNMENDSCAAVTAELRHVWESLAPYFTHTQHNHLTETVGAVCGVCRSNTGPSPVTFGAMTFHTPCANLYLHCVDPVLPNVSAAITSS